MDKEKTKDLIKIMQASLEGEVIECKLMYQSTTFADGTPFGMKVTDNCPMLKKALK